MVLRVFHLLEQQDAGLVKAGKGCPPPGRPSCRTSQEPLAAVPPQSAVPEQATVERAADELETKAIEASFLAPREV